MDFKEQLLQQAMKEKGFHFTGNSFTTLPPSKSFAQDMAKLGLDAVGDTPVFNLPSNGVPAQYLIAYATTIIEQIMLKRAFKEVGEDYQIGSFETNQHMIPVLGYIGSVSPYGDFSTNGKSGINATFPMRDFYRGQTNVQYGDLENEQLATAKINNVAFNQKAAATAISIGQNKAFFYGNQNSSGVFLSQTYGFFNDPAITYIPATTGSVSGKTFWSQKQQQEITFDIKTLYQQLQKQLGNNLRPEDKLLLIMSGQASGDFLANFNQYGLAAGSAYDQVKKVYPNLELVIVPECNTNQNGSVHLVAQDCVDGGAVRNLFSYQLRTHRLVPLSSSAYQKFSFGTGGCLIVAPLGVASMSGIGE